LSSTGYAITGGWDLTEDLSLIWRFVINGLRDHGLLGLDRRPVPYLATPFWPLLLKTPTPFNLLNPITQSLRRQFGEIYALNLDRNI